MKRTCGGLALLFLLLTTGCREATVWRGQGAGAFLEFDSELRPEEAEQVNAAVACIENRDVRGERVRWFEEIFGGTDADALHRFLSERVSYLLSDATDIESRVRVNAEPIRFQRPQFFSSREDDESGRGATNLSALWYLQKAIEPERLQFEINNRLIPVDSTRVGIVQLGPAFLRVPPAIQAGVLLHEGRHSDCTGGIWQSDIDRVRRGESPEGVSCGHFHVLCPAGHDYAGIYACDAEPWGAYSVNFIYWAALARACTDCSDEERALTEAAALDSALRLLLDVDAMLRGDLGRPDMGSSTEVVPR